MNRVNQFILRRVLKYSASFIHKHETALISKYRQVPNDRPVIFILGAPRTGSTILYQLITSFFEVTYLDNLVNLGRETPFVSYLLSRKIFGNKGHRTFSSQYGRSNGLHEPSEAGILWRKFMPKNFEYISDRDIDHNQLRFFSDFITAVNNKANTSLIVKNLYFTQRLRFLKASGLNLRFIFIKRDPVYTAQSIFLGRKQNMKDINCWWSVSPSNYEKLKDLDVFKQIAAQVYYLEKDTEQDLKLFSRENILTLWYEDLVNYPYKVIDYLKAFIGVDLRDDRDLDILSELKNQNKQKVDDDTFNRIVSEVDKLYNVTGESHYF